jgi:hypothetical protein
MKIVQAMLVYREGDLLDESIPADLEFCDKLLILLDNQDEYTEKKVLYYKERFKDKVVVEYSGRARMEGSLEELNRRFKKIEGSLRDHLLDMARKEDDRGEIDILTMFDADEVPIKNINDKISYLLRSQYSALMYSHCIDVVGDYRHFTLRNIHSHCRIFKYNRALTALPERGRLILRPLIKKELFKHGCFFVHLPYFNLKNIYERSSYKRTLRSGTYVWETKDDIRTLSDREITRIFHREPLCLLVNYINTNK